MEPEQGLIQFKLDHIKEEIDRSNAILNYIVNRTAHFFLEQEKKFILLENYSNTIENHALLEVSLMISTVYGVPVLVKPKNLKENIRLRKIKHENLKILNFLKKRKVKLDDAFICSPKMLHSSSQTKYSDSKYSRIDHYVFEGISLSYLKDIVDNFFNYTGKGPTIADYKDYLQYLRKW